MRWWAHAHHPITPPHLTPPSPTPLFPVEHNTHPLLIVTVVEWQAYLNGSEMLSALARIPMTVGYVSIKTLQLAVEGAIQLQMTYKRTADRINNQ